MHSQERSPIISSFTPLMLKMLQTNDDKVGSGYFDTAHYTHMKHVWEVLL